MTRATWLAKRQAGLGGSDIGAVVGLDPFRGPLDVYLEKTGELAPDEDTPDLLRGRTLEPIVARMYAAQTGRKLTRVGLIQHSAYPFLLGTPDRRFPQGVLEIKTQRVRAFVKAKREGLPAYHVSQLQWYMALTGVKLGAYALFSAENWEMIAFDVEANQGLQKELLEAGRTFWEDHVIPRKPPTGTFSVPVEVQKSGTELVVVDTPMLRAGIEQYVQAHELKVVGETLLAEAKDTLKEILGGVGAWRCGNVVLHVARVGGRRTLDRKALEAARPIDREKLLAWLAWLDGQEPGSSYSIPYLAKYMGEADVNLKVTAFDKQGTPYTTLRVYVGNEAEDE